MCRIKRAREEEIRALKDAERKRVRAALKAISGVERLALDKRLSERVLSLPVIREAEAVYAYASLSWEPGTDVILRALFAGKVRLALPRVSGADMEFYEVTSFADLKPGAFGIREPGPECGRVFWPKAPVFVPGMAFTEDGGRLGKGGGYYDKFLSREPEHPLIGLAYECQRLERVPLEAHDRKMDFVVWA